MSERTDIKYEAVIEKIAGMLGEPRNYGPTPEEKEAMEKAAAEAKLRKEAEEQAIRERREAEEAAVMEQRQREWVRLERPLQLCGLALSVCNVVVCIASVLYFLQLERLEEVRCQEREVLELQSIPLRNYLMKHVMPTLTQGLIQCCQVRPDDPVDYLVSGCMFLRLRLTKYDQMKVYFNEVSLNQWFLTFPTKGTSFPKHIGHSLPAQPTKECMMKQQKLL